MHPQVFSLALSTFMLAVEAQQVIALRMLRLMAGGTIARKETNRMVTEKAWTFARAGRAGLGVAGDALGLYRRKVRANRRRLARA